MTIGSRPGTRPSTRDNDDDRPILRDATVGEYATAATADDFAIDHLARLVAANDPQPVSGIARHWRLRRHADAGWTWLALVRSLGGTIPA